MMTFFTKSMLAQVLPSGTAVWEVVIAAGVLASIVGNIAQWNMSRRKRENVLIKPQPFIVQASDDPVSKSECLGRHQQSSDQISGLSDQVRELRLLRVQDAKDSGASREKMYIAIKDVRVEVMNIHEETRKEMTRGFADIERALGRLEGKINAHDS